MKLKKLLFEADIFDDGKSNLERRKNKIRILFFS